MSWFLDTNICIYALKGSYSRLEKRIRARTPDSIKIPSIVRAELLFGAEKSAKKKETLEIIEAFLFPFEIVGFCSQAAEQYARIRADLERKGNPVGPNDLLVASTVATHNGVLVTHNVREFRRVKSIKVEDWTK